MVVLGGVETVWGGLVTLDYLGLNGEIGVRLSVFCEKSTQLCVANAG